jgi:Secretion system C-terminal sorting domain
MLKDWTAYRLVRIATLLWVAIGLHGIGNCQQPFVRYYPNDTADLFIRGVMPLANGDFVLSVQLGIWYPKSLPMRVDAVGTVRWEITDQSAGVDFTWGWANLGDSLFFTGGMHSLNQQLMTNPSMRCFDATGMVRWEREYDRYTFDQFTNVGVSRHGILYGLGVFQDSNGLNQTFVQRLGLDGQSVWRLEFTDVVEVAPSGMAVLPNGSLVFSTLNGQVSHLHQIDSAGNVTLDRAYPALESLEPFREIRLAGNGNLLCPGLDSVVRAFTVDGDLVQSIKEGRHLRFVQPTADGGFLTQGSLTDGNDFYLHKYDASWNAVWYQSYALPRTITITDVVEIAGGDLVLVGMSGTTVFDSIYGLFMQTDCQGSLSAKSRCGAAVESVLGYQLYPNPSEGVVVLQVPTAAMEQSQAVSVFNGLGQLVWESVVPPAPAILLDLRHLPPGLYHVAVMRGAKRDWVGKVMLVR